MIPAFASNNFAHGGDANAIAFSENSQWNSSDSGSYFNNLFFGKLIVAIVLALSLWPSPLINCIPSVLFSRSDPKMIWIYAERIVPSWAVVKDIQAIRNFPAMDDPRKSRRDNISFSANPNKAIGAVSAADPNPAAIRFDYLFPESFENGFGKGLNRGIIQWYSLHLSSDGPRFCLADEPRTVLFINSKFAGGIKWIL